MRRPEGPVPTQPVTAAPRLTAVMRVGGAMAVSLSADQVAHRMRDAYGWDLAFGALLLLRGPVAQRAAMVLLEDLVLGPLGAQLGTLATERPEEG